MLKKSFMHVTFVLLTLSIMMGTQAFAQGERAIVPYPRDILVETINPASRMPQNVFCIGMNTIDVKLTNTTGYSKYVEVINQDTWGRERSLYTGVIPAGISYLSTLLRTQLQLVGPPGTEMVRVDVKDQGQSAPGRWVTFHIRDCGGTSPGGTALLNARVYPYAIAQGEKGTITLQTNVESRTDRAYYFDVLNSWDQLWKRIPVNKRPYEPYRIPLPVGEKTQPGILTYTVNLWLEIGSGGERQKVASARFSFRVVEPGSMSYYGSTMYPGGNIYGDPYSGVPSYYGAPYYGTPYSGGQYSSDPYYSDPYSGEPYMGSQPYMGTDPYMMSPYGGGIVPQAPGYYMGAQGERSIQ